MADFYDEILLQYDLKEYGRHLDAQERERLGKIRFMQQRIEQEMREEEKYE